MPDWLGLEWWRFAWGPVLAAGLVWLASTWKVSAESRASRDLRLDARQDRELARLDAENEELQKDRDRGWDLARWWWSNCHELRHAANHRIMSLGGGANHALPELPGFEQTSSKKPPS
jgi:hypothetical protein